MRFISEGVSEDAPAVINSSIQNWVLPDRNSVHQKGVFISFRSLKIACFNT